MASALARLKSEGPPSIAVYPCVGSQANRFATWQGVKWNLRGLSMFTGITVQDLLHCCHLYGIRIEK